MCLSSLWLWCGATLEAGAETYESLWKQVRAYEKKDLPKSAYKVVQRIGTKADKEKAKGQQLAALLYGCVLRQQVVPDSFYTDVPMLERRKRESDDEVMRAIYASVLGELYDGNARRNRNYGHTEAHPDSLREWSYNQFKAASAENFRQSMAHPELLAEVKAADFIPFVEKGRDAAYFNGDLLNVIVRRAVNNLSGKANECREQKAAWYGSTLRVYRNKGNRQAELLMMLDSVDEANGSSDFHLPVSPYKAEPTEADVERRVLASGQYRTYTEMLDKFGDLPLSAEIYIAMTDLPVTPALQVKWAEEGIRKYPAYPRTAMLKNRVAQLQNPFVNLDLSFQLYPERGASCEAYHRNLSGAELRWYLMPDRFSTQDLRDLEGKGRLKAEALRSGRMVKKQRLSWSEAPVWDSRHDTLPLEVPALGGYVLMMVPDGASLAQAGQAEIVGVTRMHLFTQSLPGNRVKVCVVDAMTGAPVPEATVTAWYNDKVHAMAQTDRHGVVVMAEPDMKNFYRWNLSFTASKEADKYMAKRRDGYSGYVYREDNNREETERVYTDRAIYRPGQTVYVGGLCYIRNGKEEKVVGGRSVLLALHDANGKKIAEREVVSDEMGKISTDFVLPATGVSGNYSVRTSTRGTTFAVEEYKRPTFEVTLQPVTEIFHAGDTVRLTGEVRNFTGVPVRHARVTAESSFSNWFSSYYRGTNEKVRLDTVYTDDEGKFVLTVPVRQLEGKTIWIGLRQKVEVEAMNGAGETHKAQAMLPLSRSGLQVALNVPKHWEKAMLPDVAPTLTTATGEPVKDSVTLTCDLFRLKGDKVREKIWQGKAWQVKTPVKSFGFEELPVGRYELSLHAATAEDTAEAVCPFVLFDKSDVRPVEGMKDWFHVLCDTISSTTPAHLQVGSTEKDVTLYYTLFCKDKVLEDTLYEFSDSVLNFTYPYRADEGDGLSAHFTFVKEGRIYHHEALLTVKQPDKELRFEWTTFRDRLQPGASETWKLRVLTPDGKPASAQVMAAMYDASLDQIRPHAWFLRRFLPKFYPYSGFNGTDFFSCNRTYLGYTKAMKLLSCKNLSFDSFNHRMMTYGGVRDEVMSVVEHSVQLTGNGVKAMKLGSLNVKRDAGVDLQGRIAGLKMAAPQAVAMEEEAVEEDAVTETGGETADFDKAQLRENLNETAFFYPRLTPDEKGDFTIEFTLPESLTSWKFMALAHTKDMMTGVFTDEVVAAKEVMAQLNLPRFVRVGDRATLSASLYNLTETPLKGRVTIEVFDPASGKSLWKDNRKLALDASADTVVMFAYTPKEGVALPACRVLFEAGQYTDGEQRYLPVLENKEWLTQTLPFVVQGKGTTEINLDGLFQHNHPDAARRRLTVEYTANPLWYAVQALPSVLEPRTDDALSLTAALYASVLSSRLADRYPQLKTAAAEWMRHGQEQLKSPLETQEDLKGILLDETPWVKDADAETRRMQGLMQLFDVNRQDDLQRGFCQNLKKLQNVDGGIGWFSSMRSNPYMTLRVAQLLGRAGMLSTEQAPDVLRQNVDLKKLMAYLTAELYEMTVKDKKQFREHKTHLYGAESWLSYLYVIGLADKSFINSGVQKDVDYAMSRLMDGMHGLNMSDKARAAVVLQRAGRKDEASQLVRSLREHLVESSAGTHLEYPSNGYYSSDRKIETHVYVMEALQAAGTADEKTMDGLCRWLLGQKQVQAWSTTVGSMNAVYALVNMQHGDLKLQASDEVSVLSPKGHELMHLASGESQLAGLGSVQASMEGKELERGAGKLVVNKAEERPAAWGAAYAQFQLPLAEVDTQAEGVGIRCEVSNMNPKVGDRVTLRYVITADRDYEYVCLKAGRAACLEPVEARSGYSYGNGLGYYREVRDASTNYFFERLPKGTYVLEAEQYVERSGVYTVGVSKLNGVYAPEFSAYGNAPVLTVRP